MASGLNGCRVIWLYGFRVKWLQGYLLALLTWHIATFSTLFYISIRMASAGLSRRAFSAG